MPYKMGSASYLASHEVQNKLNNGGSGMSLTGALGIANLVAGIANSGMNIYGAWKQDQRQDEANQYTREMNALTMAREDNAVQRRLADVKSAGFSPLVAANLGGAGSGSFQALGTASGDYSGAFDSLSGSLNAISQNRLARRAQDFQEKQYEEGSESRDIDTQLKGLELAEKAIEFQNYAKNANLDMDSKRLANDLAQKALDHADTEYADKHQEAQDKHLDSSQSRSESKARVRQINKAVDVAEEQIKQIKADTSLTTAQEKFLAVQKAVQESVKRLNMDAHDANVAMDKWAKKQGKANFQEWFYSNFKSQQLYENIVSGVKTVADAADSFNPYNKIKIK